MLTPLDIHNKEFHRGLRGYREDEVDDFLDRVVKDFEELLKENAALKDQMADAQRSLEQYRHLESTLHSTLIVAQETAEGVKESARKEAELIVREAEEQAVRIRERGVAEAHDAEERLKEIQRRLAAFRAQVRSLLESELQLLSVDPAPAAAATEEAAAAREPDTGPREPAPQEAALDPHLGA